MSPDYKLDSEIYHAILALEALEAIEFVVPFFKCVPTSFNGHHFKCG